MKAPNRPHTNVHRKTANSTTTTLAIPYALYAVGVYPIDRVKGSKQA